MMLKCQAPFENPGFRKHGKPGCFPWFYLPAKQFKSVFYRGVSHEKTLLFFMERMS